MLIYMQVYLGPLNRTTNLFLLLIVISFILPITSIRIAQAQSLEPAMPPPVSPNAGSMANETGGPMANGPESNSTGFGQPQPTNTTGFGQDGSNTGFRQQPPPPTNTTGFGQDGSNTGFGQPPPANTTGFGQPQQQPTNTTGFGLQQQPTNTTGFGLQQPTNTTGFGQDGSNAGFGQQQQQPTNTTGFGQPQQPPPPTNNTGFGQPQQQPQQQPPTNNTGNAPTSGPTNTTGSVSADLAKSILDVMNGERATVGSPALVWNKTLAADAKTYADHLATTGKIVHPDAEWVAAHPTGPEGENLVWYVPHNANRSAADYLSFWLSEKKDYHGGPTSVSGPVTGHYTQIVWNTTKSVGCGIAVLPTSVVPSGGDVMSCRFSPPGNIIGVKPY
jgi:pathogenesis-related protein 1